MTMVQQNLRTPDGATLVMRVSKPEALEHGNVMDQWLQGLATAA
jgi:hypothetical protein